MAERRKESSDCKTASEYIGFTYSSACLLPRSCSTPVFPSSLPPSLLSSVPVYAADAVSFRRRFKMRFPQAASALRGWLAAGIIPLFSSRRALESLPIFNFYSFSFFSSSSFSCFSFLLFFFPSSWLRAVEHFLIFQLELRPRKMFAEVSLLAFISAEFLNSEPEMGCWN